MANEQTPPDSKANILLVDDHPANLLALEAVLADLGHLVRASSGEEALRHLLDRDFAAVLLDVRMRGLDGFQTAKLIRSRPRSRHTPIIFLTAYEENRAFIEAAYALGAVDYLVKPIVPIVLRAKVAVFIDLFRKTEQVRQQASAALRQSEERFAHFMQHLPGLAWIKDGQGRYLYANDAAVKAFQTPRAELYGKTDPEVFPPQTAVQFQANDRAALAGEAGVRVIETLRHEDGTLHHSLVSKFPIPGPEGEPLLVGGMAIDITDRLRAEEELRRSEELFRTLADSIPQLAWMARPDGHIFWYNRRWYDYTGTTPEQMAGWGWQSVHDPAELPRVLASWRAALAAGEAWEDTFPLRRHDGQMRWHLSRALPVRDEQGQVVRWLGTNTDISERRQMEEALRQADRRKDEFLAMLAHELRNPLAPIRTALHLLGQPDAAGADARQAREMVARQVQNLVRLVDDLLDVSRITRGKIQLRVEPLELAAVVGRAVEATRPLIDANRHHLTVALPAEPLWVEGDPTRLEQVFTNLLNNAAKYTERGGSIWVTGERQGGAALVRVRDTGFGIPAAVLPHVFELFTQSDRTLDRSQGGLGIGLTLVKTLVELHGGTVEADSGGPGQGSEFVVRLPLGREAGAPAPVTGQAAGAGSAPGSPLRVLVVDDNRDAAESLAVLLRLWGHEVRTAHDGQSGLKAACSYRPQFVFLDIGLPGLDGYAVARRLREEFAAGMRLVAMTGYGQEEDRRRSHAAGFDRHLVKPVELESLREVLAEPTVVPPGKP
jgi:PAS domain S-box-containing protein